jgi:hypothetical protein
MKREYQKLFKGIKLGWAMPCDWSHLNYHTHLSCMAMIKPDIDILETPQSGDVAEKREGQCEQAIKDKCTHVALLDSDMVFYPEVLIDMFKELKRGADMVGGLCYRGAFPFDPLIWHPTEERKLTPFRDYQFGDVVDSGATGAACLLMKIKVLKKLKQPWFRIQKEERVKEGVNIVLRRGEDTYFTRKATGAGFKLRVITKEDIGHMREFQVDRAFWLLFGIVNRLQRWEVMAELFKKTLDDKWLKREFPQLTTNKTK